MTKRRVGAHDSAVRGRGIEGVSGKKVRAREQPLARGVELPVGPDQVLLNAPRVLAYDQLVEWERNRFFQCDVFFSISSQTKFSASRDPVPAAKMTD